MQQGRRRTTPDIRGLALREGSQHAEAHVLPWLRLEPVLETGGLLHKRGGTCVSLWRVVCARACARARACACVPATGWMDGCVRACATKKGTRSVAPAATMTLLECATSIAAGLSGAPPASTRRSASDGSSSPGSASRSPPASHGACDGFGAPLSGPPSCATVARPRSAAAGSRLTRRAAEQQCSAVSDSKTGTPHARRSAAACGMSCGESIMIAPMRVSCCTCAAAAVSCSK